MKLPRALLAFQDRLAALLGCEPSSRITIIDGMLHRSPKEATGYWLQLVVAAGIATFGLVLGSTAVVIGAMLVAPLMGPIISFGMGLAIGSPFLVIRGAVRVTLSVGVVVAFAAGVTRLLPFHEVNAEIAARTTPTALDLATAVFCAVAGVYAAMRPASDVATTAAGTSIGISLVPPLCVTGYGIGTSAWPIASGASLLPWQQRNRNGENPVGPPPGPRCTTPRIEPPLAIGAKLARLANRPTAPSTAASELNA